MTIRTNSQIASFRKKVKMNTNMTPQMQKVAAAQAKAEKEWKLENATNQEVQDMLYNPQGGHLFSIQEVERSRKTQITTCLSGTSQL